ncbi:Dps family protein [Actinokineospora bangkokensis]|uniref:DNA starvation/stationary phase protection protein n=1 Tax=Actinokineospora bangkokensis TaxID=1193682 RepID=A0A1Q9LLP9_9PSEU|nr:DNA starvation/stationary phase protection protein [Actinokineospora bangkokensis]OLR92929.1 DNA starvation/stationary phase protection protein [Actinokineospora bangkokensis]
MTADTTTTTTQDGFVASTTLVESLQQVLVNLLAVQLEGKNAHWNVTGSGFRSVHLLLDEVVDVAREHADTVAERLRALHATPDGRPRTVAAGNTLTEQAPGEQRVPAVLTGVATLLTETVEHIRSVHDAVDEEDPTTADLLHEVIHDLEEKAWMLRSENEDR